MYSETFWTRFGLFVRVGQVGGSNLFAYSAGNVEVVRIRRETLLKGWHPWQALAQVTLYYALLMYMLADCSILTWRLHLAWDPTTAPAERSDSIKTEMHLVTRWSAFLVACTAWRHWAGLAQVVNTIRWFGHAASFIDRKKVTLKVSLSSSLDLAI